MVHKVSKEKQRNNFKQPIDFEVSMRSFGRVGSGMSVLDFLHIGSTLSLRSYSRVGGGTSTYSRS